MHSWQNLGKNVSQKESVNTPIYIQGDSEGRQNQQSPHGQSEWREVVKKGSKAVTQKAVPAATTAVPGRVTAEAAGEAAFERGQKPATRMVTTGVTTIAAATQQAVATN